MTSKEDKEIESIKTTLKARIIPNIPITGMEWCRKDVERVIDNFEWDWYFHGSRKEDKKSVSMDFATSESFFEKKFDLIIDAVATIESNNFVSYEEWLIKAKELKQQILQKFNESQAFKIIDNQRNIIDKLEKENKELKLKLNEMKHQLDYALEQENPVKEMRELLKSWKDESWSKCEDCGTELEVRCPKEIDEERQKTIEMIDINFFMKFEQFFSRNQHTFHGDNCSTCCDLVKEFIEKDLKKRVEKI